MDERMRMNAMQGGMGQYPIRYGRSMARRAMRRDRAMRERDMRRGDRGMSYGYGMQGDMAGGNYRGNNTGDMARRDRGDYANYDMRGGMDGHHYPMHGQQSMSGYKPIEFMGYCNGYYGMPEQDYARRDRGMDYGYDMARSGRNNDYGYMPYPHYPHYPPMDYGYPMGDFGETLSEQEMEEWKHKLMSQLDEQERQMFSHEAVMQKVKQLGRPMDGFGEKELCLATLMVYTDYKNTIGKNPDMAIRLAYDWLTDKDVAVKGAEKLAVYYDEVVKGDKD